MIQESIALTCPAKAGDAASAYFFDTTADQTLPYSSTNTKVHYRTGFPGLSRIKFALNVSAQNVTAYFARLESGSHNWVVINGGGSGELVTAGTLFERDWAVLDSDVRVYVTNGATAPTLWEPSLILVFNDNAPSL